MAVFVGKGRASTIISRDISKAFSAVLHSILAEELRRCELNGPFGPKSSGEWFKM